MVFMTSFVKNDKIRLSLSYTIINTRTMGGKKSTQFLKGTTGDLL